MAVRKLTTHHTPAGYVVRMEMGHGMVAQYRWNPDGTHSYRWSDSCDWEPIGKMHLPADVLHEFVAEQDRQEG